MALAATKAEIAKAKRLWEANALPISALCRMVGRSPPWLYHHMRQGKWQGRTPKAVETVKPKAKAFYRGRADWQALAREEVAARDYLRYGRLLADVHLLRRRGFPVNCEGAGLYRVGNALVDADQLVAKAARERRLLQDTKGPHP